MRSDRLFALILAGILPALQGCAASASAPCIQQQPSSSQLLILQRQKKDTEYEIKLRQAESDQMMAKVRGAIGVSNQWLERKSDLTEKITQLRVKEHDIDLQIEDLSKAH